MKRILAASLLAVALSSPAFGQGKPMQSGGKVEDEIMKLEDQWVQSRATKDPATTRSLLADDYLGATPDGQVQNKQQFIDSVVAGTFAAGKPTVSDRKVHVYGDTAISTGTISGVGASGTDKVRYMRVFVKRNNRWQVVATQATRITGSQ